MINKVILVGRLTRDPELRKTPSGTSYSNFTVAVDRRKSRSASASQYQGPTADFISCVAWSQTAELLCSYMHKGSQIGVEGRIQTRNYDDPNIPGRKVYVTEVVCENITFLESKSASTARSSSDNNSGYYQDNSYDDMESSASYNISSDDLPF